MGVDRVQHRIIAMKDQTATWVQAHVGEHPPSRFHVQGTRVVGELSEVLGRKSQLRVEPREPREVAHKHGQLESYPVTRRPI